MKIIKKASPYEFDTDCNGFPTFTKKNVNFIKAILRYESPYSIFSDKTTPEYNSEYPGILEKGDFFKFASPETTDDYLIDDLYRVIVSIDKLNSTHLSSEGRQKSSNTQGKRNKGREKVAKMIRDIGGENLKQRLSKGDPELVGAIASKDAGGKHNFSFATKFCSYVSIHALGQDNFCIYDEILQSILPYYAYMYVDDFENNENCSGIYQKAKGKKKNKSLVCKKYKEEDDYKGYRALIDEILTGIESKLGEKISYSVFDCMLWFYFKGSVSKVQAAMDKLP